MSSIDVFLGCSIRYHASERGETSSGPATQAKITRRAPRWPKQHGLYLVDVGDGGEVVREASLLALSSDHTQYNESAPTPDLDAPEITILSLNG